MKDFPLRVEDFEGRIFELSRERWSHITFKHGELADKKKEVLSTVRNPGEVIPQSDRNDTLHYFREEDGLEYNDYICVVVNIEKEFIVTAYPTSQKKA